MKITIGRGLITRCEAGEKNPALSFVDITEVDEKGRTGIVSFKVDTALAGDLVRNMLVPVGMQLDVVSRKYGRDLSLEIKQLSVKVLPAPASAPAGA